MDNQTQDERQMIGSARFQERATGGVFSQERWEAALQQLRALVVRGALPGAERELNPREAGQRSFHEGYQERRNTEFPLEQRLREAEAQAGRTLEGKEAQAGERYNGPLMYVDKDYLAQLNEKDNTLVLHDRSRIANGTEWAAEGKQAEISYSPSGTGIAQEHDRTLEHQGREVARDHETSREASLEHDR